MKKSMPYISTKYHLRQWLFLLLLLAVSPGILAQTQTMRAANKRYENLSFKAAIELYEQVLKKDPANREAQTKLADSYRQVRDMASAERVYAGLVTQPGIAPKLLLYYAQTLAANRKYSQARQYYEQYAGQTGNDTRGKAFAEAYSNTDLFFADSAAYTLRYTSINSAQADFSPTYYQNGLVFVSGRRQGTGTRRTYSWNQTAFLDLYALQDTSQLREVTEIKKTATETAKSGKKRYNHTANDDDTRYTANDAPTVSSYGTAFGRDEYNENNGTAVSRLAHPINSKYHEGPVAFLQDADSTIIFTRSNYHKGKYGSDAEGVNKLKLFKATYRKGTASQTQELPFNSNEYSVGHPAFDPATQQLYFVSDMPGGKGLADLYVTTYRDGTWSKPENVTSVNSEGNDMFPFIDSEGNLFFASDGHPGLGGLDVFRANKRNSTFEQPVNMGYPLNTFADDFGMITHNGGQSGYVSSNRRRSTYDDDIYSFTYKPIVIEGVVVTPDQKTPLDSAVVTLTDGSGKEIGTLVTDKAGKFSFPRGIQPGKEYQVAISRKGYGDQQRSLSAKQVQPGSRIDVAVPLTPSYLLTGTVYSLLTKDPLPNYTVILKDAQSQEVKAFTCGTDGKFYFNLAQDRDYTLVGKRVAGATATETISTRSKDIQEKLVQDLYLTTPEECEKIVALKKQYFIENIYYDLDKYAIRPDAEKTMQKILELLQVHADVKLLLSSHTDSRASSTYNLKLSRRRAEAVISYLTSRGIAADRLSHEYYSENKLTNECQDKVRCDEHKHQLNRRTEFSVLLNGVNISTHQGECNPSIGTTR